MKKFNKPVYALKNKDSDIRLKSSSGGVSHELAKHVIANKGYVFGVVYNEKMEVIHYGTNILSELDLFYGSKYVQSNLNNSYKQIEELLKEDKLVLFIGTPCQVYGLTKFLKEPYENLLTCDFVCHGVPKPKVFSDYKKEMEKKFKSKITEINFRYKDSRDVSNILLRFKNGKKYIRHNSLDRYYKLFLNSLSICERCFSCSFSNLNRVSDITIGDFWGIEKSIKNFDDYKGVSLCIINTEKGNQIFNNIKNKFDVAVNDLEHCLQPNLVRPTPKNKDYDDFWECYNKYGYEVASKKYATISLKVKIKNMLFKLLNNAKIYRLIKNRLKGVVK